jgi:hypothetical protein
MAKCPGPSASKASQLLRQNRRHIIDNVTRWTGHRKYDIHQLVNRLIQRCEGLKLYADTNHTDDLIAVTALITAIASNIFRVNKKHRRS